MLFGAPIVELFSRSGLFIFLGKAVCHPCRFNSAPMSRLMCELIHTCIYYEAYPCMYPRTHIVLTWSCRTQSFPTDLIMHALCTVYVLDARCLDVEMQKRRTSQASSRTMPHTRYANIQLLADTARGMQYASSTSMCERLCRSFPGVQ